MLSSCTNTGKLSKGGVEMAQTAVTENPSGETYPGKFIWHDLMTPDLKSAGKFYEQLFGWQIKYEGRYAEVRNGGKLIAGILQVDPADDKDQQAVWLPSVSVADVDAAASLVEAGGGTILKGPLDMDKRGRAVLISDPQRADIVLLSAKGGDPSDENSGDPDDPQAAIGDWMWDEIWTHDPDATEDFYASVLGYDAMLSVDEYDVFLHKGKWRAGIRHLQDDKDHMAWVPVVRVADPEAIAAQVKDLGGIVWIAPGEEPSDGDNALIADPTGALFLIQRWPSKASEEEH